MTDAEQRQIDTMAKDLCEAEFWEFCEESNDLELNREETAKNLYDIGYRKRIKAEWKSGNKNGQYGYYCTNCDACFTGENAEWIAKEHDYCPKCGAIMEGEK